MGYRTPNIDRIADEGMRFTDSYGEQSCTAGRSSFITGQSVFRTGLSKVGMPGADVGLQAEDATIAELLKPLGYATGQFGKNHLGDLNKFLPTVHGFDEFFGNLYHLNAEEEPETPNWPPPEDFPRFNERFRPRGVLHSWATEEDDDTEDERYGRVGRQRIEDTGPLTKKRMETIDDEVLEHALDFVDRQAAADTPFFCWFNTTHMHFRTHPKPESVGQAGRWQSPYHDTMIDHDKVVGALLDKLDELGLAEDTIVVYSTDNGPHMNTWPDGGMTPFRSEKNTNWEGAFRVPEMIRWPGKIPAGVVSNEIIQHHDWLPTFLAAAASPTSSRSSRPATIGHSRSTSTATTCCRTSPARSRVAAPGLVYFSDDGDLLALRFDNWKVVFMEQRVQGTLQIWAEPFVALRVPKLFNLRMDPFERADITSNTYYDWLLDNDYIVLAATGSSRSSWPPSRSSRRARRPRASRSTRSSRSSRRADLGPLMLASWNDGAARTAIVDFVDRVSEEGGTDYVPPAERVAVLDNDGTLWCERRRTCRRCTCSPGCARRPRRDPSWPSSRW